MKEQEYGFRFEWSSKLHHHLRGGSITVVGVSIRGHVQGGGVTLWESVSASGMEYQCRWTFDKVS